MRDFIERFGSDSFITVAIVADVATAILPFPWGGMLALVMLPLNVFVLVGAAVRMLPRERT
jgi:hypothetical protein